MVLIMKKNKLEKIFSAINIILLILISVIMIYPYLNQLAMSLNDGMDTAKGGITIFPRAFTWNNYATVFKNKNMVSAVRISVLKTVIHTVLGLIVCYSAAYALTRKNMPYKKQITLFLMIPTYISAGVIPGYMLFRYLHLINNFWVYVLPGLFVFYNFVIMRSFLQEIPESIEESAKVDGANDIIIMYKIIVPLSLPVIATVALWLAVGAWNSWTDTLMYVTKKKLFTLQYMMMKLIKEAEIAQQMAMQSAMTGENINDVKVTSESVKSATLIVTTIPIIMVYPFLQKYFVSGVTIGAVKG